VTATDPARIVPASLQEQFQRFADVGLFRQLPVKILTAVAVFRLCAHDDDAAFSDRRLRGGHAFDGLIDVLIQRVTAV
jgi:hypothetical protein